MIKRRLGDSELEIMPLVLGGNVFGWTADEAATFRILDAFVEAGGNLIDTADVYSRWVTGNKGGESESLLGKWLRQSGKRDRVLLATKVGSDMGPYGKGLSKVHIMRSVEDSLKRLQTNVIDLYQSHRDDPNTPIEETLETYGLLIKQGKIRAIGASNFSAARLRASLEISANKGYPAYQSLQPRYNLYDRSDFETDLAPLCREKSLSVITYSSLASGFLTGKYRTKSDLSKSIRGQGMGLYLNDRGLQILAELDLVAKEYRSTPAAVALAWIMTRPGITAPIASATSVEQLKDLMAATQLTLERSAIEKLEETSASR